MRGKEEAQDYRYFPDPDLLPVVIAADELAAWKEALPELPRERGRRFMEMTGLPAAEVEVLVQTKGLADFFEAACAGVEPRKVAALILGPLLRECNARGVAPSPDMCADVWKMTPEGLGALARVIDEGLISAKIAADIFGDLFTSGVMPDVYVKEKGLAQISDSGALEAAVDGVIAANPDEVAAYRGGKTKLMSFFVGQVMRATKGKANPALVNELLSKKLA